MDIKLTDVIRDAASNLFIISGIVLIVVMVSTAVWILRKRGPGSPWVNTITESLPVLGLIGTFLGAFYVFIVPSEGKEGIVVAFIVSVVGWVGYIILQFITTSKIRTPEQTLAHALGLTRNIKHRPNNLFHRCCNRQE